MWKKLIMKLPILFLLAVVGLGLYLIRDVMVTTGAFGPYIEQKVAPCRDGGLEVKTLIWNGGEIIQSWYSWSEQPSIYRGVDVYSANKIKKGQLAAAKSWVQAYKILKD